MSFNFHKFSEDEGHRRDRVQKKIKDFFEEMSPVDSNAYMSPENDKVVLSLGDTHSDEYDKFTEALREKLKDEDIEIEDCDECGAPDGYTAFYGFGGFAKRYTLAFVCTACGRCHEQNEASGGCLTCNAQMFRVARREFPLIENPQNNVYRDKKSLLDNTDGDQFTTPLSEGDISGSGLGQNSRYDRTGHDEVGEHHHDETMTQNHSLPEDQDAFDPYADRAPDNGIYDQALSPALVDDDSPLNPLNNRNEPKHTGPFNMPHNSRVPSIYNAWKGRTIYDRIKQKTKGL